jgi:hypothetical protein
MTKRDTSVNVRLTSEEREALQLLADRNRRTLSDYIRLVLQDHMRTKRLREAEQRLEEVRAGTQETERLVEKARMHLDTVSRSALHPLPGGAGRGFEDTGRGLPHRGDELKAALQRAQQELSHSLDEIEALKAIPQRAGGQSGKDRTKVRPRRRLPGDRKR